MLVTEAEHRPYFELPKGTPLLSLWGVSCAYSGKYWPCYNNTPAEESEQPPPPRPLLVKFVSRRSKARVLEARSNLRPKGSPPHQQPGQQPQSDDVATNATDEEHEGQVPLPVIYITDDLTKLRAYLAYRARVAKRQKEIADTWVSNSKVHIKDNHSRIYQIRSLEELDSHKTT